MAELKQIKRVAIDKLIPYVNNAKVHSDAQVTKIAASIREFGFVNPVLIDRDFNIIAGHGRVMAARKLDMDEVPCLYVEGLSDAQRKAYILADNRLGELADWDMELVTSELEMLQELDFNIDLTGFELPEPETEIEEDEIPEPPEEPVSKPGDIWKLGDHRVMCGDSTSIDDVEKLLGGVQADLYLTDPPYNVDYVGKTKDALKIQNDKMADTAFIEFLTAAFAAADSVLKEGGAFYIWYADLKSLNFLTALDNTGWELRQKIVWNKNTFTLGRSDYQWKHELCLYGWKDGAAHYFIDDRTQTTVVEDSLPDFNTLTKAELVKILQDLHSDKVPMTVINCEKPLRSDEHPTMKPVKLMGLLIRNSSRQGETVLDVFGGSGSTLIACEQLNRRCRIMELDPHYCDVILERWENFAGTKAVKINA